MAFIERVETAKRAFFWEAASFAQRATAKARELCGDGFGVARTLRAIGIDERVDERGDALWHVGSERSKWRRAVEPEHDAGVKHRALLVEPCRDAPGEALEEHRAEGVEVARGIWRLAFSEARRIDVPHRPRDHLARVVLDRDRRRQIGRESRGTRRWLASGRSALDLRLREHLRRDDARRERERAVLLVGRMHHRGARWKARRYEGR